MNAFASELEFVDREEELAFLAALVPPKATNSSLTIIRSPAGFGKSRLTDQLLSLVTAPHTSVSVIDPDIRAKFGAVHIYDGYFLQRASSDLSARDGSSIKYGNLRSFLSARRWQTAKEKSIYDLIKGLPSLRSAYSIALDYVERLLGKGRFSADRITESDTRDAVRICAAYVEHVVKWGPLIFVVREAQHIDHESLRLFLQLNRTVDMNYLILEYTTESGSFDPDHEKVILREIEGHQSAHILDLLRLDRVHLEYLIRRHVSGDFRLSSDYYVDWNGNLRSVMEMKYRLAVGRRITSAEDIKGALADLSNELSRHLNDLSSEESLLLALIAVHREAIERSTLFACATRVNPTIPQAQLEQSLRRLINTHAFVAERDHRLHLQNEDVESALEQHHQARSFIALARKSLRDHYLEVIELANFVAVSMSLALRQALALSGSTRDVASLNRLTEDLTGYIRTANDQTLYIDIVLEAITANADVFPEERAKLINWAASIAYEVSDFSRATALLEVLPSRDSFENSMLAFCYLETGRHREAFPIASSIRMSEDSEEAGLMADLIELVADRCIGNREVAESLFDKLISRNAYATSPNRGYLLRFSEFVRDFPECTPQVLDSVKWFEEFGLPKSRAYSELAAAMHLARQGEIVQALELIDHADQQLKAQIRDQHILLNNRVAVLLLSNRPDLSFCESVLLTAIRSAREDYSDLTILNNLAIVHRLREDLSKALECTDRALRIIRNHTFGDKDIYWPVCFNAARLFEAAGKTGEAQEVIQVPTRDGWPPIAQANYWYYRYGTVKELEPQYHFMARLDYHPLFLSHWVVDFEGLSLLRKAQLQ